MIDFEHVSKQYKHNAKPALEDVNFHVDDGEFVFLLGHSGAGKSTLLKLILREETPTEGRVLVNGQDVARLRRRKIPYLRRQMGIIFQDFRLIPTMTVYENIAFAMHVTNIGHKQIKERVNYMLELVHLEDKAKVYPDLLSGGEQQRVAVARALAHAPKLVIADEPTGNIDPELSLEMMELLERVSEMGITVLVVTHEHELVHRFHQRVVTLSHGRIVSDVPADPVAAAEDDAVLEAVDAAHKQGIADAILVGDEAAIRKIAAELNIDLSDYEIINEPDKVQASLKAVKLAHDGVANMYMKGLLDTKTFLKSVLDKEVGLRTGNTLSHVAVFEVKGIEQLLFLTDVAFMTYPTLEDKVHIIENTVAVAHACGVECPKIAPLAAVEVVNPKMPCTVDADELRKMNAEGKITGCVVDGPLSMDIAIDPEAAHHKGAQDRPAAGHADILLFPDIQAGNLVYKTLVHTADCKNGCILTGTKVPAILTSRSDSFQTKVNSIALAAVVAAGLDQ